LETIGMTPSALGPSTPPDRLATARPDEAALRLAARDLEAAFLAEMLKSAGFGETRKEFDGGAGEDQFASFLRAEHARAMADNGGIGLAEAIFNALKERGDAKA
jgi:Rod binding domain-containing protein